MLEMAGRLPVFTGLAGSFLGPFRESTVGAAYAFSKQNPGRGSGRAGTPLGIGLAIGLCLIVWVVGRTLAR